MTLRFKIWVVLLFAACTNLLAQKNFTFNRGGAASNDFLGSVKFGSVKKKVIIPVEIGGQTRRFILDTGAPLTISDSLYLAMNLREVAKIAVRDQSGLSDSMVVTEVPSIIIGGVEFKNIPALVAPGNLPLLECFGVDGFIGSNMLRKSVLRISGIDSTVTIASSIEKIELSRTTRKNARKLFLDRQSGPILSVALGHRKNDVSVLIDTGMEGLFDLTLRDYHSSADRNVFSLERSGFGNNSFGFHGKAKDTTHHQVVIPCLMINGLCIGDVVSQTTSGSRSRIGSDLLLFGAMTIDYHERKFYFEPDKPGNELVFPFSPQPLEVTLDGQGNVVVGIIWDAVLAERIAPGDIVVSVNGDPLSPLTICDVFRNRLSKNPDEVVLDIRTTRGTVETVEIRKKGDAAME